MREELASTQWSSLTHWSTGALLRALLVAAPNSRFYCVRDGMDNLCQWLVDASLLSQHVSVRTECAVTSVALASDSDTGARSFHVRFRDTRTQQQRECELPHVDELVLATTADVALRLLTEVPESIVHRHVREFLETQQYASNVHATFLLEHEDVAHCRVRFEEPPTVCLRDVSEPRSGANPCGFGMLALACASCSCTTSE